jgi:hypothetical protein
MLLLIPSRHTTLSTLIFCLIRSQKANSYHFLSLEPDPLRLRYRMELHELVADIVRNKRMDVLGVITRYADNRIDEETRPAFAEMVKEEIRRLHEGIITRYRIRPSEFAAWREARKLP